MFNVGGPEIVLVILVALVVLGPEQLPKAMRTFGSVMGEVRKLSSGFQNEMRDAMNTFETEGKTTSSKSTPSGTGAGDGSPSSNGGGGDRVDEVVARNDGPSRTEDLAEGSGTAGDETTSALDRSDASAPDTGSSGPSAADRAAG